MYGRIVGLEKLPPSAVTLDFFKEDFDGVGADPTGLIFLVEIGEGGEEHWRLREVRGGGEGGVEEIERKERLGERGRRGTLGGLGGEAVGVVLE